MREIKNKQTIDRFLEESKFQENFSFDITKHLKLFHFNPQDYIVKELEQPMYLYYIVKGTAKLYITSPNGKVNLIDFFKKGSFIGEVELLDDEILPKSVQSVEDTWCLALSLEDISKKAINDVLFLQNICKYSFKKNHKNIITTMQNQSFKLENKFAHFILLSSNNKIYSEKHTTTAQYLGVSYRHLLDVLSNFIDKGFLRKQDKVYVICDELALMYLAKDLMIDSL